MSLKDLSTLFRENRQNPLVDYMGLNTHSFGEHYRVQRVPKTLIKFEVILSDTREQAVG